MTRLNHYIKRNYNSESIQRCIFVDTETDPVPLPRGYTGHMLRFGWACAARREPRGGWTKPKWKKFTHYEDFWLWTMSQVSAKHKTWVWCHNSSFDYQVLHAFEELQQLGWKLVSSIIDAPPTVIRYRLQTKTLVLCDTLNLWRMSLKELGERVGLDKLEMPDKWTGSAEDDQYCKRDVEIIQRAVCGWADWLKQNDMGGFAPTIAAQAMRSFRHRWMKDKILIDDCKLSHDLARACYHGGRCEAGYIGHMKGPIYSLDVNSMYPFVMSYARMPLRLKTVSRWVQPWGLRKLLEDYCVCASVRIRTDEPVFAIVRDGKLTFPVGEFNAHLTTPELEYALNMNAIQEVYLCASYECGIAFDRFALDLYKYKEEAARDGRLVEARHWKLILNSFYGKWGQSGRHWVKVGTCDPSLFLREVSIDAQTLVKTVRRKFGGIVYERSDDGESSESHPAIAAHVCAHARMVLWTLVRKIPLKHYLYCDTDGLLVTQDGFNALRDGMDNYELGKLKHVATFDDVTIYGCKDLVLDGKETLKGIRKNAIKLDEGKYRQIRWTSLRGSLALGSLNMPTTRFVDKTLRRTYGKGIVGADGFVTPLHLEGE
jgi:DNA polymerase type B, organellar and viral